MAKPNREIYTVGYNIDTRLLDIIFNLKDIGEYGMR